jgi:hypothetical protein
MLKFATRRTFAWKWATLSVLILRALDHHASEVQFYRSHLVIPSSGLRNNVSCTVCNLKRDNNLLLPSTEKIVQVLTDTNEEKVSYCNSYFIIL